MAQSGIDAGRGHTAKLPRRFRRRAQGLTLTETLLSLFLLVLSVLPVLTVLMLSQTLTLQAQARSVAYNIARREIEILRARSHTARPVTTLPLAFNADAALLAAFPGGANAVQLDCSFSIGSTTSTSLRQAVVSVRWRNLSGIGQSSNAWSEVRLDTLIASEPAS